MTTDAQIVQFINDTLDDHADRKLDEIQTLAKIARAVYMRDVSR